MVDRIDLTYITKGIGVENSSACDENSLYEGGKMTKAWIVILLLCLACLNAEGFTNDEIADAIFKAENSSEYPYGIKSLKYENRTGRSLTKLEWARFICKNTIRNNRKRYSDYGYKRYDSYLEFLASRYCPKNCDNDPRGLNKHWLKNVKYLLEDVK